MSDKYDYDLLIIGSGPGGYVAAIRASQLGLETAIIEKDKPGGVCLNIGCIPSKALIHQAQIFSSIKDLEEMGIKSELAGFDYKKVYEKSREAANSLSKGIMYLLKKNNIELIEGRARLTHNNEITLEDGKKITANNIIIATGSSPREIPGFSINEETVLSSTGILMMQKLPEKLLILGGGAIGIEFAYIMNAFGVEVHVVEMLDRILPTEDGEIVKVLHKSLSGAGIRISTSTKALSFNKDGDTLKVSLENDKGEAFEVETEKILVAVGRMPNTKDIGLEDIGVNTSRGFIETGDYYETNIPGVFAIGDVIMSPQLAHVASKEGEIAVEYIAGEKPERRIDPNLIPGAVYCEPQVAGFGYTEEKAAEEGLPFNKAVFPYRGAGKSVAVGKPEGLIKVIYDKDTHEILGGHAIGADATEIIHEMLLAKSSELLPEDIARMIHAHPTLSEAVMEAMRTVEGWPIHF